jgi:hypothetical protein
MSISALLNALSHSLDRRDALRELVYDIVEVTKSFAYGLIGEKRIVPLPR